jgi:hypothetical protein
MAGTRSQFVLLLKSYLLGLNDLPAGSSRPQNNDQLRRGSGKRRTENYERQTNSTGKRFHRGLWTGMFHEIALPLSRVVVDELDVLKMCQLIEYRTPCRL